MPCCLTWENRQRLGHYGAVSASSHHTLIRQMPPDKGQWSQAWCICKYIGNSATVTKQWSQTLIVLEHGIVTINYNQTTLSRESMPRQPVLFFWLEWLDHWSLDVTNSLPKHAPKEVLISGDTVPHVWIYESKHWSIHSIKAAVGPGRVTGSNYASITGSCSSLNTITALQRVRAQS